MKALILLVSSYSFISVISADDVCDSVNVGNSCYCLSNKKWNIKIHCNSRNEFIGFNISESSITTLELSNIKLDVMSQNVFIKLNLMKLILRRVDSYFMSLPSYPGFLSATNETLKMLEIYDSRTVFSWDIDQLGPMKHLTHLVVVDSPLYYVISNIDNLNNLEYLELRNDKLETIRDDQFSKLHNLRLLSLSGNNLKVIKRKMLPQPAEYLWHLDFSHNKISQLPTDIFNSMLHLKEVRLDHNELQSLSETLSYVRWQLKELWIHDNPLDCRKELSWMKSNHLPVYTWMAQCTSRSENQRLRS